MMDFTNNLSRQKNSEYFVIKNPNFIAKQAERLTFVCTYVCIHLQKSN